MELEWLSVSRQSTIYFAHRNKGSKSTGGYYFETLYKLFSYDVKKRDDTYKRVLPWEFML